MQPGERVNALERQSALFGKSGLIVYRLRLANISGAE